MPLFRTKAPITVLVILVAALAAHQHDNKTYIAFASPTGGASLVPVLTDAP